LTSSCVLFYFKKLRKFAFLFGIGNGGIRGITSGDIPLGLEELGHHNTHSVFGVWRLGFGVWGLAPEDLGFRVCGRTSFVYEASLSSLTRSCGSGLLAGRRVSKRKRKRKLKRKRKRTTAAIGHGDLCGETAAELKPPR
jgi:hypothetical protein